MEVINEPYIWLVTLGMYPIFSIISLPIDVVVDTALLPVDHVIKTQKDKTYAEARTKHKQETQSTDNQQQSALTPSPTHHSASPTQGGWLTKPDTDIE
ncbi:YceK/YidQ family lipoprotein [Proteus vulgaris]|uniref:YceK/YidQ family lipoprotein n=1 Tax=Proteus vulgaris TaxID=585 RepID=UPI0018E4546D|nr:YceK/YidQ family lipoprotein [Proteus vulgaris]